MTAKALMQLNDIYVVTTTLQKLYYLNFCSKESCHAQTSNKQAVTTPITVAAIYLYLYNIVLICLYQYYYMIQHLYQYKLHDTTLILIPVPSYTITHLYQYQLHSNMIPHSYQYQLHNTTLKPVLTTQYHT